MSEFKWKKYGKYAITANNYAIAKYIVADSAKYGLWEMPNHLIKVFNTSQEAKDYAVDYHKTKPAVSDSEAKISRLHKKMENSSYGK
jgi:hypothetical protein